ncbi:MAG: Small GTP-binding domain protein [Promethearchaeota archaeon]|nr:MAG: Small GTP-binding domain protein [Candidatus Lokiarchaeota archaeon]
MSGRNSTKKVLKFKIVVAGSKDAGKTSLIRRYATGKFTSDLLSTIGVDFETKKVDVDDMNILLNIWDFAGEEKFRTLFPAYVSGASAALLLYDITNKDSLDDLHDWIEVITSVHNRPKTLILIEAKCDLEDQRVISREAGMNFFKEYHFNGNLLPTSAKTGENVEKAFEMVGTEIVKNSLTKCPNCGNFYPIEQKICQYCGKKTQ